MKKEDILSMSRQEDNVEIKHQIGNQSTRINNYILMIIYFVLLGINLYFKQPIWSITALLFIYFVGYFIVKYRYLKKQIYLLGIILSFTFTLLCFFEFIMMYLR